MHRQWLRVGCVLIMLAVAVASVYQLIAIEQQRALDREAATGYDTLAWTLTAALADLRGAQQAYVATGQDPDLWIDRAAQTFTDIDTGLTDLRALSVTTAGAEAVDDALAAMGRLRRIDEIAREHAVDEQWLMASDLVFTDGRDLAQRAASHLELARTVEQEARSEQRDDRRRDQTTTAAAVVLVALLVTLLLFPAAAVSAGEAEPTEPVVSALAPGDEDGGLEDDPFVELSLDRAEPAPVPVESSVTAAQAPTTAVESESVVPDLKLAAAVCTDLGQLSDGAELESILTRAGQVLNASGLVLWVRDGSGSALRAATGYGYTARQLSRLGRVPCDSDNVTAAAYRTERLQTVRSTEDNPGAVAVPLLAPTNSSPVMTTPCVGVLAVEVAHGWEQSEAVQATASILAAQLATFVTADPSIDLALDIDTDDAPRIDDEVDTGAADSHSQAVG